MSALNLQIAKSGMEFIANLGRAGMLESSGVSRDDFNRLVGSIPWAAKDRGRVTLTLQTLIEGSVDALGLDRFPLPAEYIAAGIAMFVQPMNVHYACRTMAKAPTNEALSRKSQMLDSQKSGFIGADQLFALVQDIYSSSARSSARSLFEKNTGLALEFVENGKGK